MAIAGRVAIVPKGEWSQSVTYDKLDLVTYNGNTFIAYKSSVGVTPVDGDTWMLVMQGIDPQDIENIIDGTTPVGDTLNLGGKGASEYALDTDLANYLPLTGGRIYGNSSHPFAIRGSQTSIYLDFENVTDALVGAIGFSDVDKPVFVPHTYEAVYRLLHSGNVADYALPIGGGTVENVAFGEALHVKRTTAYDSVTTYENSDGVLGYIGMSNTKKPIYTDETKVNTYEILHTGNSAKVVQATSAPSDTTAVWVDTANKVTKIYKDGAWTALA